MKRKIIIISSLATIIVLIFGYLYYSNLKTIKPPKAVDGYLDLSNWDFDTNGSVNIKGTIEFYWNHLYSPSDFALSQPNFPLYHQIPSSWKHQKDRTNDFLPKKGFGTYRFIIKVNPRYKNMGIKLTNINTSYRLWINSEELLDIGKVGTSEDNVIPQCYPNAVSFQNKTDIIEIIMQVSNYHHNNPGIPSNIYIGTRDSIFKQQEKLLLSDGYMFFALVFLGIFHLIFYIFRKQNKSILFFAIFTLVIGLRVIFNNQSILTHYFPEFPWVLNLRLNYLTLTTIPSLLLLFIHYSFPDLIHKIMIKLTVTVSLFYSIIVIFATPMFFSSTLWLYQYFLIFIGLYINLIVALAVREHRVDSLLIFSGFFVMYLCVINDVLFQRELISSKFLSSFGWFFFVSLKSISNVVKITKSLNREEEFTTSLEKTVNDRTRQLIQERNKLKIQNKQFVNELILAKKIQTNLIPHKVPLNNIYTYYKPMEHVGGDFFDFIKFDNPNEIGIFLSDVSGHGVPAAFVTAILKTLIVQRDNFSHDPALLLQFLNSGLYDQTGGNYITAFYGIYNQETKSLRYSVAGHYPPIVISNNKISTLVCKKTLPLAIMTSDKLDEKHKKYLNYEEYIEPGSKLILYTDGLLEASNANKPYYFFESQIDQVFAKYSELKGDLFIQNIIEKLMAFRGNDKFEDDICMICVDV